MHIVENSKQSELFYILIEKNIIFLEKIIESLITYSAQKKYINNYLHHISDHIDYINYDNFLIIKNKKIHSMCILACAIL
jgi:hypothetical protein